MEKEKRKIIIKFSCHDGWTHSTSLTSLHIVDRPYFHKIFSEEIEKIPAIRKC